jgi:cytochrome c
MQSEGPPLRTVGSYWPHASTLFDFIRRAMPAIAPKSLTNQQVYQVTAYVLYMNNIIAQDTEIDATSLNDIEMPNADGFIDRSHIQ